MSDSRRTFLTVVGFHSGLLRLASCAWRFTTCMTKLSKRNRLEVITLIETFINIKLVPVFFGQNIGVF